MLVLFINIFITFHCYNFQIYNILELHLQFWMWKQTCLFSLHGCTDQIIKEEGHTSHPVSLPVKKSQMLRAKFLVFVQHGWNTFTCRTNLSIHMKNMVEPFLDSETFWPVSWLTSRTGSWSLADRHRSADHTLGSTAIDHLDAVLYNSCFYYRPSGRT